MLSPASLGWLADFLGRWIWCEFAFAGETFRGRSKLSAHRSCWKAVLRKQTPQPQRNPNHSKTTTTAKTQPQQNRMQVYAQHKKRKHTLKTHEKQWFPRIPQQNTNHSKNATTAKPRTPAQPQQNHTHTTKPQRAHTHTPKPHCRQNRSGVAKPQQNHVVSKTSLTFSAYLDCGQCCTEAPDRPKNQHRHHRTQLAHVACSSNGGLRNYMCWGVPKGAEVCQGVPRRAGACRERGGMCCVFLGACRAVQERGRVHRIIWGL